MICLAKTHNAHVDFVLRRPGDNPVSVFDDAERNQVHNHDFPVFEAMSFFSRREAARCQQPVLKRLELFPAFHRHGPVHILRPAAGIDTVAVSEDQIPCHSANHENWDVQRRGNGRNLSRQFRHWHEIRPARQVERGARHRSSWRYRYCGRPRSPANRRTPEGEAPGQGAPSPRSARRPAGFPRRLWGHFSV